MRPRGRSWVTMGRATLSHCAHGTLGSPTAPPKALIPPDLEPEPKPRLLLLPLPWGVFMLRAPSSANSSLGVRQGVVKGRLPSPDCQKHFFPALSLPTTVMSPPPRLSPARSTDIPGGQVGTPKFAPLCREHVGP